MAGIRVHQTGLNVVAREKKSPMFSATYSCVGQVRINHVDYIIYSRLWSVPLFWTQSGYSLKPAPALSPGRNHEQNLSAIRRHFSKTIPRYGAHVGLFF